MEGYMRRSQWLTAIWCAAGLVLAAPIAMADGMPARYSAAAPQVASFQGFYVGTHSCIASGDTQGDPGLGGGLLTTDFNLTGALYGAQIGYNLQQGNTVYGLEGTWSHSSIQGDTNCVFVLNCKRDIDWVATVVGRLGMVYGRTLTYGFAGVAWGDVDTNVSILGTTILSGSDTHVGWTAGFGFEHAFTNTISGKIEYAHIDLGSKDTTLTGIGTITDKVNVTLDTVRLGINIKLSN
jgi:outer membrane immunogenic protein